MLEAACELIRNAPEIELPFPMGLSQLELDILEYLRQLQWKLKLQEAFKTEEE